MLERSDIRLIFEGRSYNVFCEGNRCYISVEAFGFSGFNARYVVFRNGFYVSLINVCKSLNLKALWNYGSRTITFTKNENVRIVRPAIHSGRPAFIRFEDVTAGNEYITGENLSKFRDVGDYMYSQRAPYHIAWIPRFIDPPNQIDNDISRDFNMPNMDFLFTLEYLCYRGGILGLHGYTHQYGDEMSGDGTEFNDSRNTEEDDIRERLEAAISIAGAVGLPYHFFESPHYAATTYQQSVFEYYFKAVYEGYVGVWGNNIILSPRNGKTFFVPTPAGYVEGEDGVARLTERIGRTDDNSIVSLFYHPYAEFEHMPYGYGDSPLQQIVAAVKAKGCGFRGITDFILRHGS